MHQETVCPRIMAETSRGTSIEKLNQLDYDPPRSNSPKIILSKDDIHIWFASLDQSTSKIEENLSADELAKANRFYHRKERNRYVACHGILRAIMSYYLDTQPDHPQISYNHHGKPSLVGRFRVQALRFNLAHSDGLALYALTLDREVGVDLERITHIAGADQFADRFFVDEEQTLIHALSGTEKDEALFQFWTRKEAYLKACGRGLPLLLAEASGSQEVRGLNRSMDVKVRKMRAARWSIAPLAAPRGFAAAIAVAGAIRNLAYWRWHNGRISRIIIRTG